MLPNPDVGFWLASALMGLGIVVQFVVKMASLEDAGEHYSPLSYLRLHPWRAAALVLTAWLALYVCFAMGEVTKVTAVLIGFGCEQANDWLRARANQLASRS